VTARRADAALVFTCNGRGTRLFGEPHHDVRVLTEHLGAVPMAGFFAAGELGPVGGRNFVHGFTASVALLSDRSGIPLRRDRDRDRDHHPDRDPGRDPGAPG